MKVGTNINSLGDVETKKKGQSPSSRTSETDWIKRVGRNIYRLQSKLMSYLCGLKQDLHWRRQDQWTARRGFYQKHLLVTLWSPQWRNQRDILPHTPKGNKKKKSKWRSSWCCHHHFGCSIQCMSIYIYSFWYWTRASRGLPEGWDTAGRSDHLIGRWSMWYIS